MTIKDEILKAIKLNDECHNNETDKQLFSEIDKQLKHILECIARTGDNTLIEKDRLTMGVLAVREIENWNPELADLIYSISYFAKEGKMRDRDK